MRRARRHEGRKGRKRGGSGAAEASAAATAEEDKRIRALRIALQHKTQMHVTDEEAQAILQARRGRETPVTEEEARVIFRGRGGVGRGRATFQARARGRGGRATASPALASKGGEELSRRGKKAVAKEAGEAVSREEGEAIYRATLESLLSSTGWTPRAAEEMAREEQRAHVRQMRWAREHGRGEPVRCFDAKRQRRRCKRRRCRPWFDCNQLHPLASPGARRDAARDESCPRASPAAPRPTTTSAASPCTAARHAATAARAARSEERATQIWHNQIAVGALLSVRPRVAS